MKQGFFKIKVSKEQAGMRLDLILATVISRRLAKRLLSKGAVFVNKKRVKVASRLIPEGSVIRAPFIEMARPPKVNWDEKIIFQNEDFIVVNKPEKWAVAPTPWGESGTISHDLGKHIGCELVVVQRLDFHTTGCIIFAKNRKTAKSITSSFEKKNVVKTYLCITKGTNLKPKIISLPIQQQEEEPGRYEVNPSGLKSITEIIETKNISEEFSLLKLILHTGRTHQIRVHLSHLESEVYGDPWYGNAPAEHMYLHSYSIKIKDLNGSDYLFKAPLPEFWENNFKIDQF